MTSDQYEEIAMLIIKHILDVGIVDRYKSRNKLQREYADILYIVDPNQPHYDKLHKALQAIEEQGIRVSFDWSSTNSAIISDI